MHCTPEQLALAALRESLPVDDALHLERCERCRRRVAALQRGVEALAVPELAAPSAGLAPPPAVWEAIAAATGVRTAPRPERTAPLDPADIQPLRPASSSGAKLPRPRRLTPRVHGPSPRNTDRPRSRRRLVLAAVAAAVLGAGIALGAVTLAHRPVDTQVAATRLQTLERSGASGTAVVRQHADHTLELAVTLRGPRPASGYYEAWLADPGLDRMVAVGALHDGTTTLPLPVGLSLDSFPVVDVSVQQLNGDPAHSDRSVARGQLR